MAALLLGGLPGRSAWAAVAIYQDYAVVNGTRLAGGQDPANGSGTTKFQANVLGAYSVGQSLLLGSDIQTLATAGSSVTGAQFFYRVYLNDRNATVPDFTSVEVPLSDNNFDNVAGRQRWTNVGNTLGTNSPAPAELLAGLTASGEYVVEVYWAASGTENAVDNVSTNGAYYQATFTYSATPLPVTLTAFGAQRQGADAVLSWTTATETNNAGYEVQVSASGYEADFRVLGWVAAPSASSQTPRSYHYTDQEPGKVGMRYYRLRQLDLGGTATFSPVRMLTFEAPAAVQVLAWPNPFQQELHLSVSLPQASPGAILTLRNALGQVVLSQALGELPAGTSQPALGEVSQLPAGLYLGQLALPTGTQQLRLVKQ